LLRARPADRVRRDQAEGDEEQIGLIDVAVVPVDDRDLGLGAITTLELVRDQCAAGTGAEDEDSLCYALIMPDRAGFKSSAFCQTRFSCPGRLFAHPPPTHGAEHGSG